MSSAAPVFPAVPPIAGNPETIWIVRVPLFGIPIFVAGEVTGDVVVRLGNEGEILQGGSFEWLLVFGLKGLDYVLILDALHRE